METVAEYTREEFSVGIMGAGYWVRAAESLQAGFLLLLSRSRKSPPA